MGKVKNGKIEEAEKKLKFTRYLQFQMTDANREIDEIEDEISTMEQARVLGSKLTQLKNRLEYWKGKRDAFQEIWNYKKQNGI